MPMTRLGSEDLASRHSLVRTQVKRSIELTWHMIRHFPSFVEFLPFLTFTYLPYIIPFLHLKNIFSPSLPYFTTCMWRFSSNLRASKFWNSRGLSRTVQGLLYRPCFPSYAYILSFLLILFRISLNSLPWPTPFLHTCFPNHHCMHNVSRVFCC